MEEESIGRQGPQRIIGPAERRRRRRRIQKH
jgi:hypothetical protein